MNKVLKIFLLILSFHLWFSTNAQNLANDNSVYKSFIKTVLFYKSGFEMSAPIITLNSNEKLELSFDDLESDLKRYKYTIIHCESDWKTSGNLVTSDYIGGINEENLDQFSYSSNTTVPYIHFTFKFPSDNLRPKISGNYILEVYIDDPSDVAFTRRFMVLEPTPVGITGEVHQASGLSEKFTSQEVDFEVRLNGLRVADPSREIKVMITQNDRWDNAISNLKPRFLRGEVLDYNYDVGNSFKGGNEYRYFDIKSLRNQSERVLKIDYDKEGYKVYLMDDKRRTLKNYVSDKDINGRKMIKSDDNAQNNDIEADYAWVFFSLPLEEPVTTGQIYLVGALTDWQLDENSKLTYNTAAKVYSTVLLLKQGFYNYLYILKDFRTSCSDEAFIEGSHWETENVYTIYIYYHEMGGLYDRLIALQNLSSVR
jgi:hypothetical protein